MTLKWGIVGAGKISNEFVKAVKILPPAEHEVVAVASQTLDKAQEFSEVHSLLKAYGDYQSLASDKDIDAVYIGNLNTQHLASAKLMLENGKHVLCEKPLTLNAKQTRELITLSHKKGLFLMEAIWSRCFPAYEGLRTLIDNGEIGEALYVSVAFGNPLNHIDRINFKELGGGTVLDLGVYTLQFIQYIFKGLQPLNIIATGHLNKYGTDESASAVLTYSEGRTGVMSTHSHISLPNEAVVIGTKGTVKVPTFYCATSLITSTGAITFELPKTDVFTKPQKAGMSYEVEEVRRCIKAGLIESPKITHSESLQLAHQMDKLRQDIGVIFPEDC